MNSKRGMTRNSVRGRPIRILNREHPLLQNALRGRPRNAIKRVPKQLFLAKRGRPKNVLKGPSKKIGRPKKALEEPPKKRGRPKKAQEESPKKRGRPRKPYSTQIPVENIVIEVDVQAYLDCYGYQDDMWTDRAGYDAWRPLEKQGYTFTAHSLFSCGDHGPWNLFSDVQPKKAPPKETTEKQGQRKRLNSKDVAFLVDQFMLNAHPTSDHIANLADILNTTPSFVDKWFQLENKEAEKQKRALQRVQKMKMKQETILESIRRKRSKLGISNDYAKKLRTR